MDGAAGDTEVGRELVEAHLLARPELPPDKPALQVLVDLLVQAGAGHGQGHLAAFLTCQPGQGKRGTLRR